MKSKAKMPKASSRFENDRQAANVGAPKYKLNLGMPTKGLKKK